MGHCASGALVDVAETFLGVRRMMPDDGVFMYSHTRTTALDEPYEAKNP